MKAISGLQARLNGILAEQKAKQYLIKQGLCFVASNYHCRWGEIDLIFKDKEQVVFVEVKSRDNHYYGSAAEYYTSKKQKKLLKSVQTWLTEKGQNPEMSDYRIDVVALTSGKIEWFRAV